MRTGVQRSVRSRRGALEDDFIREIVASPKLGLAVEVTVDKFGEPQRISLLGEVEKAVGRPALRVSMEILEYLDGRRRSFSGRESIERRIKRVDGSFYRSVLLRALEIPYGETLTYSELATSLGSRAFRAVGNALARNPLPILVPCHRVVAKNGIGGFSAGQGVKAKLLSLERTSLTVPLTS